jgi:peptidyl-prolyl cis-trans isomerase C
MRVYTVIKKSSIWWVLPLVCFLCSPLSCNKAQPLKEKELARINDKVITLQEFEQKMGQLPQFLKRQMIFEEGRRKFLQELINQELLFQEARRRGLDKNKEILVNVQIFKKGLITNALREELCAGKDEVSDEEVASYYQEHKEEFILEKVRVRHIMVETLPEAQKIKRQLEQGEDFITLARKFSISPESAKKGGDLGYVERGIAGKEFEQAAFALKKQGELSDIVKAELGYHIIRLEDKIGPRQLTFPEVQEEIRNRLRNKKREKILTAYLQDLREGAQIIIHEELLATEKEDGS